MAPLPPGLRRDLERAVVTARETAPSGLSDADRAVRVALRARARSLGNGLTFDDRHLSLAEKRAAWGLG